MKILYIAQNKTNDFLSDSLFHGLNELNNIEIIDYNKLWYMYNDYDKKILINTFHGRGFSYYGLLESKNIDRENIIDNVKSFDFVIYGNPKRCLDNLDFIKNIFSKNNIIFIDGNDEHNQLGVDENLLNIGNYYRRELSENDSKKYGKLIKPISFAFPKNKIINYLPDKTKVLANVIPGVSSTFIFDKEIDYFNDYKQSMFGFTWRKAGWDCLRHYEILANGCIPLFLDIIHCPKTICTTLPKDILIEYYKESGLFNLFDMGSSIEYNDNRTLIINRDLSKLDNLILDTKFFDLYINYLEKLIDYTNKYLSTKILAENIINENNL